MKKEQVATKCRAHCLTAPANEQANVSQSAAKVHHVRAEPQVDAPCTPDHVVCSTQVDNLAGLGMEVEVEVGAIKKLEGKG